MCGELIQHHYKLCHHFDIMIIAIKVDVKQLIIDF